MPHTVYFGLGTNIGRLSDNLDSALRALQEQVGTLLECSSYIETEPWGYESDHKFLNAVAVFATSLAPLQLLDVTQDIERTLGRTAKSHDCVYADRTIDIDILFYDDVVLDSPRLTIPHPLISQRQFVLAPLAEVAPTLVHPVLRKTTLVLLGELEEALPTN